MIYSAEEWLTRDFQIDKTQIIVGTPDQPIIRVRTKNIIEAPEKSFKTTFMLRFMLGLSSGQTVYPCLPVQAPFKVLYLHGELAESEIQQWTGEAIAELKRPNAGLWQGREINMHFKQPDGQEAIIQAIKTTMPDVVVFDPWQGFIFGLDENFFKDVSEALHFIDKVIQEFGVTVFLVTHMGKDHSRGTRGHSALACWRDTLIKLERTKKSGTLKVTVEPRWAAPLAPFHLKFQKGTLWPMKHFTGQTEEIRHYVEEQGGSVTKQAIQDALKFLNAEACRKALERAEKAGAIVRTGELVTLAGLEKPNGQPHRVGACPSAADSSDNLSPIPDTIVSDGLRVE